MKVDCSRLAARQGRHYDIGHGVSHGRAIVEDPVNQWQRLDTTLIFIVRCFVNSVYIVCIIYCFLLTDVLCCYVNIVHV